jgi:hypothetical protein
MVYTIAFLMSPLNLPINYLNTIVISKQLKSIKIFIMMTNQFEACCYIVLILTASFNRQLKKASIHLLTSGIIQYNALSNSTIHLICSVCQDAHTRVGWSWRGLWTGIWQAKAWWDGFAPSFRGRGMTTLLLGWCQTHNLLINFFYLDQGLYKSFCLVFAHIMSITQCSTNQ